MNTTHLANREHIPWNLKVARMISHKERDRRKASAHLLIVPSPLLPDRREARVEEEKPAVTQGNSNYYQKASSSNKAECFPLFIFRCESGTTELNNHTVEIRLEMINPSQPVQDSQNPQAVSRRRPAQPCPTLSS